MSRINLSIFARSPVVISLIMASNYLSRRDATKEDTEAEATLNKQASACAMAVTCASDRYNSQKSGVVDDFIQRLCSPGVDPRIDFLQPRVEFRGLRRILEHTIESVRLHFVNRSEITDRDGERHGRRREE